MSFLQRDSIRLHYQVTGHGAPLVLIGGLGMPLQGWAMQAKGLAQSLELIRLDNRGCGDSTIPDQPFTIEDMAKDILALLDHLDMDSAHVLGLSMGGFIALEMAALAPQRVKSLVLAHTTAKIPPLTRRRVRLWAEMRQDGVSSAILAMEQLLWIFPEEILQNDHTVAILCQNLIQAIETQSWEGFSAQVEACETFDILDRLAEITAPTMIIAAEDDLSAPLSHTRKLERLARVLKKTIFPSGGHASHLIRAEEFNREVLAFINLIELREQVGKSTLRW